MHKIFVRFFIISQLFILLTNCNSNIARKYVGSNKPDEFAIITNEPLVIPNSFNLPKPKDKNMVTVSSYKTELSQGEKDIINKTQNIEQDPNIHDKLEKEKKPNLLKRIF